MFVIAANIIRRLVYGAGRSSDDSASAGPSASSPTISDLHSAIVEPSTPSTSSAETLGTGYIAFRASEKIHGRRSIHFNCEMDATNNVPRTINDDRPGSAAGCSEGLVGCYEENRRPSDSSGGRPKDRAGHYDATTSSIEIHDTGSGIKTGSDHLEADCLEGVADSSRADAGSSGADEKIKKKRKRGRRGYRSCKCPVTASEGNTVRPFKRARYWRKCKK